MNARHLLLATALLAALCACKPEPMVGDDKDPKGCLPSAGYQWCAKENQCTRPWELAKEKQFANSKEAFERYCGN